MFHSLVLMRVKLGFPEQSKWCSAKIYLTPLCSTRQGKLHDVIKEQPRLRSDLVVLNLPLKHVSSRCLLNGFILLYR